MGLSPEEYAQQDGQQCPCCEDRAVRRDTTRAQEHEGQGNEILVRMICESCGARWRKVFRLQGYQELEPRVTGNQSPSKLESLAQGYFGRVSRQYLDRQARTGRVYPGASVMAQDEAARRYTYARFMANVAHYDPPGQV